jgi:hypothetical protein
MPRITGRLSPNSVCLYFCGTAAASRVPAGKIRPTVDADGWIISCAEDSMWWFERGRASWPPYPQFIGQEPEHCSLNAVWHHFRFGAPGTYPPILDARSARQMALIGA